MIFSESVGSEPVSPLKPKTLGSQIKNKSRKINVLRDFFYLSGGQPKDIQMPTFNTKFRYKIVTGKSGKSSVTIFDVSP